MNCDHTRQERAARIEREAREYRDTRYRGYWIRRNPITGEWRVEREGAHICYAKDVADAQRSIDSVEG